MKHAGHGVFKRYVSLVLVATQVLIAVPLASAEGNKKPAAKDKAPAPPPPVKVNRKIPKVTPPSAIPQFSAQPTRDEIFRAHVFEEALVPVGDTPLTDNAELAAAISQYATNGGAREDVAVFEKFLEEHPKSAWRASLLADLGLVYRHTGYYTKALAAWSESWSLAKNATDPTQHAVADIAVSHLATLDARLGRLDDLTALLDEIKGRHVGGSASTRLLQAKQSQWSMQNKPSGAFRCGPLALGRVVAVSRNSTNPDPVISQFPSTRQGTSLLQMKELGEKVGTKVQIAQREKGADLLIPAIIHWKAGHFAALVRGDGDKYLVQDPTFGDDIWMSKAAIDEEGTGYFLVVKQDLPSGWHAVSDEEGATIWGKGAVPNQDFRDIGDGQRDNGCCGGPGMPVASMQFMTLNLRITDTPLSYQPPRGSAVSFRIAYDSKENLQEQIPTYGNVGPKWTYDWLSYIVDDPSNPQADVMVYNAGGGAETVTGYNAGTGTYVSGRNSGAVIARTSTSPIRYERRYPDGSVDVFSVANGASSSRKVFLSFWSDAAGNRVSLVYDSSFRIVAAVDSLGQVTLVYYEQPGDPLRITRVVDPFGRTAQFSYNDGGELSQVTDVISMASQFTYGNDDFIQAMTTPYGTSTFSNDLYLHAEGGNTNETLTATDPMGGTERLVFFFNVPNPAQQCPLDVAPAGFNAPADSYLCTVGSTTFYWDKRAMAMYPGDTTRAHEYRWLNVTDAEGVWPPGTHRNYPPGYSLSQLRSGVLLSEKAPLESRIWYLYDKQATATSIGPSSSPTRIGRFLDDGSAQIYRYEYNAVHKVIRATDPVGRATIYTYGNNNLPDNDPQNGSGRDLLQVEQVNGQARDLLLTATYNSQHLPLTITDASGQTWTFTYNLQGQILTVVSPPRAGITENRTTTYAYDGNGYLQNVAGPATGTTATYTYDGYGRVRTATSNADSYTVTADYDALNRLTKVTYPDTTFEQATYDRLDVAQQRDRLGRVTTIRHDAVRHPVSIQNPNNEITSLLWCGCGGLDQIIDGNGHATSWVRDPEGRVTQKKDANTNHATSYVYENLTSRLHSITDAKGQTTTFSYSLDNRPKQVAHTGGTVYTADVSLTYSTVYPRVATRTDGIGTTTYTYNPINPAALGSGRLASVDGPWLNDIVAYTYDELGRIKSRNINNGVASTVTYDSLSRPTAVQNALDTFTYGYDVVTSRLTSIAIASTTAPTQTFSYSNNAGERRLSQIMNGPQTMSMEPMFSQFDYAYNANGQITSWVQRQGTLPKTYAFGYDKADRLSSAVSTDSLVPPGVHSYAYGYDSAGNRQSEQIDGVLTAASYDNDNELVTLGGGGNLVVRGATNEPATVTLQGGAAVNEAADNTFAGQIPVSSGNNTLTITAKDYSGNIGTRNYAFAVTGSPGTLAYDANGNLTGDGTRTFEWDGENRLTAVVSGTHRSEFSYDGLGRRIEIVEKDNSSITSDKKYLWVGRSIAEERDSTGATVTKSFFGQGFKQGSSKYFYTRDHLGSIREVVDTTGAVRARYSYDPFGRRTKLSGDVDGDFGYADYFEHAQSGLKLTWFRAYDAGLGRWLSRDPAGFRGGGPNLYAYVGNDPIDMVDPLGLRMQEHCAAETDFLFEVAYRDATAGPIAGLRNIRSNSTSYFDVDFKYETQYDHWTRRGVRMDTGEFGNYIAGYQAAAYDMKYGTHLAVLLVGLYGIKYHLFGGTKAIDDPWDTTGMPWIMAGERDAYITGSSPWPIQGITSDLLKKIDQRFPVKPSTSTPGGVCPLRR